MSAAGSSFLGGFVQMHDEDDPMRSDMTLLAVALLTLGVPKHGDVLFACTYERERGELKFRSTWNFGDKSRCGRFSTPAMRDAWTDQVWLGANPKHPLAILRAELTFQRAFSYTPRFTLEELVHIERPETWIETGIRNLIWIIRQMPRVIPEAVIRFGPNHAGLVPKTLPETEKTRFLRFVEYPGKRPEIIRSHA